MNEVIGYVDVRSAEVATDAIAADVAQVHQDMLDADADATAAAASAAAAAGTLANAVKKTGESSQSIAGDIAVSGNLSGGVVTGTTVTAPTPVNNTDAANKKYVDDADALKLNITDVGSYAVLLTGNQPSIAGFKGFASTVGVPPALRSGSGVKTLILSISSTSASTNYVFDLCISNKRSLSSGRAIVTTDANNDVSAITWTRGFSTGVPRCEIGVYKDNDGVLYLTISGTEGGSYNAVNILGAFGGDGYPMNVTFSNRATVTPSADYQGVTIS